MSGGPVLREEGFSLTFCTISGASAREVAPRVAESLAEGGIVLQERIIVAPGTAAAAAAISAQSLAPGRGAAPLILLGHPAFPLQYSSVVAHAACRSTRIERRDRAIRVAGEGLNILYSSPVYSAPGGGDGAFLSAFAAMPEILAAHEMQSSDIARTWLFLADIQGGYELLNRDREAFFRGHPLPEGRAYPASTGIAGQVIGGRALSLEFCAFSGEKLRLRPQPSPLQCEPAAYRKLFSRAMAVDFPRSSLLFISGTAAIDWSGASLFPGSVARQLEYTLEVLSSLLGQRQGDFADIVQAIVYLKRSSDLERCLEVLRSTGFPGERALFQLDTSVCRDDLLCEVEATAVLE